MSRLDEIRAREAAATPGPWFDTGDVESVGVSIAMDPYADINPDRAVWKVNADFIAHAREDIPFLLAEIERLELALTTATVEVHGQRMYRTRYGTPMEMPAKIERMVRSSLEKR